MAMHIPAGHYVCGNVHIDRPIEIVLGSDDDGRSVNIIRNSRFRQPRAGLSKGEVS